jgi:hypothetical protein
VSSGETSPARYDSVNHPEHYAKGGIECIQAIRAALTLDEFVAHCRATAIKYCWRVGKKDPAKRAEDLRKGAWYLERAAQAIEEEPPSVDLEDRYPEMFVDLEKARIKLYKE